MSTGKVAQFRTCLLAALIVSIGGCNTSAAPPPAAIAAIDAPWSQTPSARQQLDAARDRVWSLTRDGVSFHERSTPDKVIKVPLPDWQWAGSPYGCLPDLALGPNGEAVITSDILPTLWRIDPETLVVSAHRLALDADTDKDVGFCGLAYAPEQAAYFAVSYVYGSLWKIDLLLRRAQKIPLSVPVPRGRRP